MIWDGDRIQKAVEAEISRRVNKAARILVNTAKEVLSVPAPRVRFYDKHGAAYYVAGWLVQDKNRPAVRTPWQRITFKKNKKTGNLEPRVLVFEYSPATPGAPPRKLSGHLRRSVTSEMVDPLTARVGTNVVYGRTHEEGTHPWLKIALGQCIGEMQDALGGVPMKVA